MNNNKIVSAKRTIAIFLAIVLVTGTIALASSQSSFMVGANAQAQPYYDGGMDNRYNSYEPRDYGMGNNDRKSYGNNNYKPQYPSSSYQSDYYKPIAPKYPLSYEKENYKSQKDSSSSNSVSINKINCINHNININGNNTGNIDLGNKGQGNLGTYSSNGGGYSGEGYYHDGYNNNKQGKGFDDCVINNNNTNTNILVSGEGNQTIPPPEPTITCEECFTANLDEEQLQNITEAIQIVFADQISNIEEFCQYLTTSTDSLIIKAQRVSEVTTSAELIEDDELALQACLRDLGLIA